MTMENIQKLHRISIKIDTETLRILHILSSTLCCKHQGEVLMRLFSGDIDEREEVEGRVAHLMRHRKVEG